MGKEETGARENQKRRKQHPARCLPLPIRNNYSHCNKCNSNNNSGSGSSNVATVAAVYVVSLGITILVAHPSCGKIGTLTMGLTTDTFRPSSRTMEVTSMRRRSLMSESEVVPMFLTLQGTPLRERICE